MTKGKGEQVARLHSSPQDKRARTRRKVIPMAVTQDASQRVVNFYLDEAEAVKLDKYCRHNDIKRTKFIRKILQPYIATVELDAADIELINKNIQKRIKSGYPKNYFAEDKYER